MGQVIQIYEPPASAPVPVPIERIGLFGDLAALRAAQSLARLYSRDGDEVLAEKHRRRALVIQSNLITSMGNATGMTAEEMREALS